mmetsp:Transcript_65533/g.154800  ORF Transcript_65533/g.154800 Transcript_65533/m.154800 type:complete len:232 (-) Transcript_65533:659-1354(-)
MLTTRRYVADVSCQRPHTLHTCRLVVDSTATTVARHTASCSGHRALLWHGSQTGATLCFDKPCVLIASHLADSEETLKALKFHIAPPSSARTHEHHRKHDNGHSENGDGGAKADGNSLGDALVVLVLVGGGGGGARVSRIRVAHACKVVEHEGTSRRRRLRLGPEHTEHTSDLRARAVIGGDALGLGVARHANDSVVSQGVLVHARGASLLHPSRMLEEEVLVAVLGGNEG